MNIWFKQAAGHESGDIEKEEKQSHARCPRCARWSLEQLSTHSYCWECNYSPDSDSNLRQWHAMEYCLSKIANLRKQRSLQTEKFEANSQQLRRLSFDLGGAR